MMSVSVETRNRCSRSPSTYVAAIQPANATAAWPDGSPPRSGVPRPVQALTAITSDDREHERDQRQLGGRVAQPVEQPRGSVARSCSAKTR